MQKLSFPGLWLSALVLSTASCSNGSPAAVATASASTATAMAVADVERYPHDNPAFPFSKAVRVGDLVFLSGQIGLDYGTGKLAEGFEAQSRQTLDNVKADLASIGLGMEDVVKCTLMIADMARWPEFNEIYREYFAADRLPARSAFGVNALALGAEMEVECIAAARGTGEAPGGGT